jgi:hypothetical protein
MLSSAGFIKHRRGKRVPSFIKQKMELRWNLLPPFLSNEPGRSSVYLKIQEGVDPYLYCMYW